MTLYNLFNCLHTSLKITRAVERSCILGYYCSAIQDLSSMNFINLINAAQSVPLHISTCHQMPLFIQEKTLNNKQSHKACRCKVGCTMKAHDIIYMLCQYLRCYQTSCLNFSCYRLTPLPINLFIQFFTLFSNIKNPKGI